MASVPENIVPLVDAAKRRRAADYEAAKRDHPPDLVDRLIDGVFEGDPFADSLVASFKAMEGRAGWEMLEEALRNGAEGIPGAPAELAELLKPAEQPPEWVDLDLVDAGALAYWRGGSLNVGLALVCGSLAYGYQSSRLARPLAATGRLTQMAPRRLLGTGRWVVVATRPGALRPGAPGIHATVRLRMVHALVRAHLLDSPDWDLGEWGLPISATDTMMTAIAGFLLIPCRALRDLGVRLSPSEREAITHQWAWIASLMGAPDDLLPRSYAEACDTMAAAEALDDGPNEDSPKLMHALLHHGAVLPYERRLPRLAQRPARAARAQLLGGFARRWMGDEMADQLGVPRTPLKALPLMMRPLSLAREVARARGLLGTDERIVRREMELLARVGAARRNGPVPPLEPYEMAEAPVLKVR